MNESLAFLNSRPTLFLLSGSPFQAMCMLEAIQLFKIKDYKVLLCLSHSELPRKGQLIEFLNKFNIPYEIESIDFKITKAERFKALLPARNKYKLAFIGDCNNELLIFKAFRYVSDGGTLLYLDDGIATIQFYNGLCQLTGKLRGYYDLICKVRKINFDNYFFTIYSDLKDNKHITIGNHFHFLSSHSGDAKQQKNIVVLGTCTDDYCRMESIATDTFLKEQSKLLEEIKSRHQNERVIFVPHGRDVYPQVKQDCKELGILFRPTNISVEMFLLEAEFKPKAIYGLTSSALYNLNLLFPDSEIINVTFSGNSPQNNRIEVTSQYFSKHGIKREIRQL